MGFTVGFKRDTLDGEKRNVSCRPVFLVLSREFVEGFLVSRVWGLGFREDTLPRKLNALDVPFWEAPRRACWVGGLGFRVHSRFTGLLSESGIYRAGSRVEG